MGATIRYVTHDQTEAMTLGTRVIVMNDGKNKEDVLCYRAKCIGRHANLMGGLKQARQVWWRPSPGARNVPGISCGEVPCLEPGHQTM